MDVRASLAHAEGRDGKVAAVLASSLIGENQKASMGR